MGVMAFCWQTLVHFRQPLHFSADSIRACLWNKKSVLPMTLFGQASMHFQQAWQRWVLRRMCFVVLCFFIFRCLLTIVFSITIYYSLFKNCYTTFYIQQTTNQEKIKYHLNHKIERRRTKIFCQNCSSSFRDTALN